MGGVFISYRREDAPGHAGRVFDRVRSKFGADVVFMDVTAIDAGADFVEAIDTAVGSCDVLLAIIGPQWAAAADHAGRRRLEASNDFVRLEIAGALKRNVRVVPVLVDDAQLPAANDLPDDLQPLLRRNAVTLRDSRWDADIDQLLGSLERIVKPQEQPLRVDAPSHGRGRVLAAAALFAVAVGAAVIFGLREWGPASQPSAAAAAPRASTPPPVSTGPKQPSSPAGGVAAPKPAAVVPDVVGRSLPDARDILRRAGVEVARVVYRDDRTKAIDEVVGQSNVRPGPGAPPAVALTAVARATIVISHKPEDAETARRLLGALMSSPATAGLAMRTSEVSTVRAQVVAHVAYSDRALAETAAGVATEATAWLRQNDPERPAVTASLYSPVASRSMVLGLPGRGEPPPSSSSSSSAAPLPDVRGLGLAEARRTLTASGVHAFAYKWSLDPDKKPLEVFGQSELKGRADGRTVLLLVNARATLWLYRTEKASPLADRFARELQQSHLDTLGILLRIVRQSDVPPETLGKVESGDKMLSREARTIAAFASNWLAKELGRPVRIEGVTGAGGDPRRLTFGLPPLQ